MRFLSNMEIAAERRRHTAGLLEGQARGQARGEARGELAGRTAVLRRQLGRKFGVLPDWAEARLASAANDELLQWADRILDAQSLSEAMQP